MKKHPLIVAAGLFILTAHAVSAQEGQVHIQQDPLLPQLLEAKTKMAREDRLGDRYKIQIFSGNFEKAGEAKQEYDELFTQWPSSKEYETPNYKVWVGNFRNNLEADRALVKIRKEFPSAFKFRPEKK